jgi:hypothetical protein
MSTIDPKKLLTEDELVELRGVTKGWLRDDRRGKRLVPFLKLGKAIRYRLADVDPALEKLRQGARP